MLIDRYCLTCRPVLDDDEYNAIDGKVHVLIYRIETISMLKEAVERGTCSGKLLHPEWIDNCDEGIQCTTPIPYLSPPPPPAPSLSANVITLTVQY